MCVQPFLCRSAAVRASQLSARADQLYAAEIEDASQERRKSAAQRALSKRRVTFAAGSALEQVCLFDPQAPLPGYLTASEERAAYASSSDAGEKHAAFERQAEQEHRSERALLAHPNAPGAHPALALHI